MYHTDVGSTVGKVVCETRRCPYCRDGGNCIAWMVAFKETWSRAICSPHEVGVGCTDGQPVDNGVPPMVRCNHISCLDNEIREVDSKGTRTGLCTTKVLRVNEYGVCKASPEGVRI